MKSKIVVGRKWNNPEIYTFVTADEIEMQISLPDFIKALALEYGNPATTMTVSGHEQGLLQAATAVLAEVKKASKEVV